MSCKGQERCKCLFFGGITPTPPTKTHRATQGPGGRATNYPDIQIWLEHIVHRPMEGKRARECVNKDMGLFLFHSGVSVFGGSAGVFNHTFDCP